MRPFALAFTVFVLLLNHGCQPSQRTGSGGVLLSPAGSGRPAKGALIAPQPWPRTKVTADQACAIACQHYSQTWLGAGRPRCVAVLTREGGRLVWAVGCTVGQVEIAASTSTVYVAADNGEVLRVQRPLVRVR
jgi:hypothetical protein